MNRDWRQQKCYICKKLGHRFYQHSKEEQLEHLKRLRATQNKYGVESTKETVQAYLLEFEGFQEQAIEWPDNDDEEAEQLMAQLYMGEQYWTNCTEASPSEDEIAIFLMNQAAKHRLTGEDHFNSLETPLEQCNLDSFVANYRYGTKRFQGIIPDSGAAQISTAGLPQL